MELSRLTDEQKESYKTNGYLINLASVFNEEEIAVLNEELQELQKLLVPGEQMLHIRDWHAKSEWIYRIACHPQILNYVEDLLGPDIYMWGTQFFAKQPQSRDTVAWHQDAYYWPPHQRNATTVWLAFTDVDEENGAMRVVPGSHNKGIIKHRRVSDDSVLTLELEKGTFNESEAKSLILKAGQLSLHDDHIVHGSPANHSDRWRIGLTIRYSGPADVPPPADFKAMRMRGAEFIRQEAIPTEKYARLPVDHHKGDEVVKPKTAGQ